MTKETIRPGVAVRTMLADMITNGKVTAEVMAVMTDKEASAKNFGLRYPLLKEVDTNAELKPQLVVYGKPRYGVKTIDIDNKAYVVTNDIYKANVPKFKTFAEGI